MPNLYIIAGCNGAGKTTASFTILPDMLDCKEFVNPDEIARGLSPFQPEKAAIASGKIMLARIKELMKLKVDFSFETTLSAIHFIKLIKEAQQQGYFVTLIFFWLYSVELAIERVTGRVREGGHDVPIETIKKRYISGIRNLLNLYIPVCDYWMVIDNSISHFRLISDGLKDEEMEIYENETWNKIIMLANEE
jgi:predicted ABC-type ATPase